MQRACRSGIIGIDNIREFFLDHPAIQCWNPLKKQLVLFLQGVEIHQHIKTSLGDIWITDALENNFIKSEAESRQEYEARFLREMLRACVGGTELRHELNGAPILNHQPGLHISISHSDNWFAIYVSTKQHIGIDLEIHSIQIERTKKYFLTKSEMESLQPTIEEAKICWGIKESVFKMLRGNMKSMLEEVEIVSIGKNEARAKFQNQMIKIKHQQSQSFVLVYTD